MTQKEIYEKCRLEASKKYRDEINSLKQREGIYVSAIKKLEDENKKLRTENIRLQNQLDSLPKNPFVTKMITEMNEVLSVLK